MTTSRKGSHQIVSFFPQTKQFWANEDFPPRAPAGIAKQGHGAGSNLHQLIALCPKGPGFQEHLLPSEGPRASKSGHGAKPELTWSLQPAHPALTKRSSHDLQSHVTPCCDLLSEGARPQDGPSRASSEVKMKHPEAPAERRWFFLLFKNSASRNVRGKGALAARLPVYT